MEDELASMRKNLTEIKIFTTDHTKRLNLLFYSLENDTKTMSRKYDNKFNNL